VAQSTLADRSPLGVTRLFEFTGPIDKRIKSVVSLFKVKLAFPPDLPSTFVGRNNAADDFACISLGGLDEVIRLRPAYLFHSISNAMTALGVPLPFALCGLLAASCPSAVR